MIYAKQMKCAALLGVCLVMVACGNDGNSGAPPWRMISGVGEFVRELTYADGSVPVYRYHDVLVYGDMAISQFASLASLVSGELGPGEVIVFMYNNKAFPPSAPRHGSGDVSVWSCTEGGAAESCTGGNVWDIVVDGSALNIVARAIWRT